MDTLLQDLRYGIRAMRRSPGFTAVAVLTLALGIGANTAIFSLVQGILLRPLPFPEADRLVTPGFMMQGDYLLARERASAFETLALFEAELGFNLSASGEPDRVVGARTTPDLLAVLGAAPALGRGFAVGDAAPGAAPVVLLSDALWRQRFGADPAIIGREIRVDSEPRTVVGVMPPGFTFPGDATRLWLPVVIDPADPVALWGGSGGQVLGRLRRGSTAAAAQAELRALGPEMREANTLWTPAPEWGQDREVVPLHERLVGDLRAPLLLTLGAVGLVLLIACANVANLLLARAAARQREIAIRGALGAGRARLIRQVLTESALLAGAGAALGLGVAELGVRLLRQVLPPDTPRLAQVGLDGGVLAFVAAVGLLTALVFGLVPALRASRHAPHGVLRHGGRATGGGPAQRRLAGGLVVAEIALAVVLATGAGLLLRSLAALLAVDPGFHTENLVSARVTPPATLYGAPQRQREFHARVMERVAANPVIEEAALTDRTPLSAWAGGMAFEVEGRPYVPGTAAPVAQNRSITPGYPRLLGMPLLSGRPLAASDGADAPDVALINLTMARLHWPGEDPVGRRFRPVWWQDRWITVVGIVGDVRQHGLAAEVEPEFFRPFEQAPVDAATLVVRSRAPTGAVAEALAAAVAAVDPEVPLSEFRPLRESVASAVAMPRFQARVLGSFALLALALGAIGIYGVVAYGVARRTTEFGVRMALGARSADVLGLVLRQGMWLALAGLAVGAAASLATGRLLRGMLFGVGPADPITFLVTAMVLALVAGVASVLPARRAARLDPLAALRHD